jgi:hypothetical protein
LKFKLKLKEAGIATISQNLCGNDGTGKFNLLF